ncbi:hypothetical protein CRUP_012726, partial [Coryphaenoides rupestris]
MTCEDRLAVTVHWNPSPLGIEHIRGFRVYVEEKDPRVRRCQHLILKDPRQLTFNYKSTKLSSQAFHWLAFDTDYLVRVVPFPTLMNDTFFPPSFLRTNCHSPWAGPIRAMAITVPMVVLSAFATLFTVMCRKKQQENIYSQLDEESSESSNHSAAHGGERAGPRPKVLVVYSDQDGEQHTSVVQAFAYFLQDFCSASSSPVGGTGSDLFIVAVAMIAEKLRLAQQGDRGGGEGPGRLVAAYFDYSSEK